MASYKHESITVDNTSGGVGLTAANIALANSLYGRNIKQVIGTVETAQIRFTVDGTAPTTTVGHLLNIGDVVEIDGADASQFRAIRTGATSGVLKCTYEI